jgi:hypothetical protein
VGLAWDRMEHGAGADMGPHGAGMELAWDLGPHGAGMGPHGADMEQPVGAIFIF